jgi:hypothetical protein
MPVFRVPRVHLEVEVSRLEDQGFRDLAFTPDGDDVLVYGAPLWRVRPIDAPMTPPRSAGNRVERPDWFADLETREVPA